MLCSQAGGAMKAVSARVTTYGFERMHDNANARDLVSNMA
jgi:hypothetical protein